MNSKDSTSLGSDTSLRVSKVVVKTLPSVKADTLTLLEHFSKYVKDNPEVGTILIPAIITIVIGVSGWLLSLVFKKVASYYHYVKLMRLVSIWNYKNLQILSMYCSSFKKNQNLLLSSLDEKPIFENYVQDIDGILSIGRTELYNLFVARKCEYRITYNGKEYDNEEDFFDYSNLLKTVNSELVTYKEKSSKEMVEYLNEKRKPLTDSLNVLFEFEREMKKYCDELRFDKEYHDFYNEYYESIAVEHPRALNNHKGKSADISIAADFIERRDLFIQSNPPAMSNQLYKLIENVAKVMVALDNYENAREQMAEYFGDKNHKFFLKMQFIGVAFNRMTGAKNKFFLWTPNKE